MRSEPLVWNRRDFTPARTVMFMAIPLVHQWAREAAENALIKKIYIHLESLFVIIIETLLSYK
jgi:hypothetical protein